METIQMKLDKLNNLVMSGNVMEAFEMFYDDAVVMQENENPPTVGKDANRKREEQFHGDILEFRNAEVIHSAVNGDISFVIWKYDFTHKDWGLRKYQQVSVQHWNNGRIIKEQ